MLDGYESISNEQRLLEDARLRRVTDTIYDIQHQLKLGLKPYNKLPLEPLVPIFVPDVHEDAHRLVKIVRDIDNDFFHWIDVHPEHAALGLKAIMTHQRLQGTMLLVKHVKVRNFNTLGVQQWLDDEIINYFVQKWCTQSKSGTLGFNTWFAGRFVFTDSHCVCAKSLLTSEDERLVTRWYNATKKEQGLQHCQRVFIPINENNRHWYCACIDFSRKQINIYDSLREVYLGNHWKSVESQKNAGTLLVLMWLVEVISRLRGEKISLQNQGSTDWEYNPHMKVPFQSNSYDCGVHTLWCLKHIIEFRCAQNNCESPGLQFTNDMTGKRLRLAREIMDECTENVFEFSPK
ncbi:hypothetical protein D9757_015486 [Collybiopsis confluens]|nr:hypothetical protein D9757_015485 [Collybiopsis confluens]KAF5337585.1 hypothetical protein D9757_015486 [Collybiopsis confluens]